MQIIDFDAAGIRLQAVVRGDSARPAVLFLHGFADQARSWDFTLDLLADRYFAIALDFRGFGRSAWAPDGVYHFPEYQLDVSALVRHLRLREIAIVGHSMGGNVATQWAALYPDAVRRLVLVEGFGPPARSPDELPRRTATWVEAVLGGERRHPRVMASLDEVAARLQETSERLTDGRALHLAEHASRKVDGGFTWTFDPAHRRPNPLPYMDDTFVPFWKGVRAPVLAVHGDAGPFTFEALADRYAHIGALSRRTVPDAGHNVHWDQPEALARMLSEFLD